MQHKITTPQHKFLLLCPAPVLLLITLTFWLLGGGQSSSDQQLRMLQMPLANPNRFTPEDKGSYYKKADTKKVSWRTLANRHPTLNKMITKSGISPTLADEHYIEGTPMVINANEMAKKEQQLQHKLQRLQQLIDPNVPLPDVLPKEGEKSTSQARLHPNMDLEQLEEIIFRISNPKTTDSERNQLNELLETVLDIPHSKRVTQRIEKTKNSTPKFYKVGFYDVEAESQEK